MIVRGPEACKSRNWKGEAKPSKARKGKAYLNSTSLLISLTTNLTTEGKTTLIDREGKVTAGHGQGRAKDLFPHNHQ
jgi:hypothetical protein